MYSYVYKCNGFCVRCAEGTFRFLFGTNLSLLPFSAVNFQLGKKGFNWVIPRLIGLGRFQRHFASVRTTYEQCENNLGKKSRNIFVVRSQSLSSLFFVSVSKPVLVINFCLSGSPPRLIWKGLKNHREMARLQTERSDGIGNKTFCRIYLPFSISKDSELNPLLYTWSNAYERYRGGGRRRHSGVGH